MQCCRRLNNTLQITACANVNYIACQHAQNVSVCENPIALEQMRERIAKNTDQFCPADCEYKKKPEEFVPTPQPERVILGCFINCNLNCYYCWRFQHNHKITFWDTIGEIIKKKFISKAKRLDWNMGEFYFDQKGQKVFLRYKKKYKLHLHVVTNGTLYDSEIPVDSLTLTLHGFDKKSYKHNCKQDVFSQVKKNLKQMIKDKRLTDVCVMMNNYNRHNIDKLFAFIEKNIPKEILVRIAYCVNDVESYGKWETHHKKLTGMLKKAGYKTTGRGT